MKAVCVSWRGIVAAAAGVALCGAMVGCSALSGESDVTYPPKERRPLVGDVTVESLTEDQMEGPPTDRGGCEILDGGFRWSESTYVYVVALPIDCQPAEFQESINYQYQIFRPESVEASPDGEIGTQYHTNLIHTVCTNGCKEIPTEVAVLTLGEPVVVDGIEYDVLNLYIDDSDDASDELDEILATLQR